jgi:hypothetical protein
MLDPHVDGEPPRRRQTDHMVMICRVGTHLLGLFALVGDGPAAVAAGAIAWGLRLVLERIER